MLRQYHFYIAMPFTEAVQRKMPKCGYTFKNIQKNQGVLIGILDEQDKYGRKSLQKENKKAEKAQRGPCPYTL